MYPLDVTMSQAGCCVAGGLELRAGSINGLVSARGHRPAPGVRLVCVPPQWVVCCKASVKACGVFALGEAQWIG